LTDHGAGSDEYKDKQSRRAPIISFDTTLGGRESPPNGLVGKTTRGIFGLKVVGEGMGRGNGESITARERISR